MRFTPNAQKAEVKIVGGSTFGRYHKISNERTYNMFISDSWLINTAGYRKVSEIATLGVGRVIYNSIRGKFLLVVISSFVYILNEGLSPTFIGNLSTQDGPVYVDENLNSQVCIVDGVNAYIYNYSLGYPNLTVQTGLGSLVPGYVEYHNTFFLFGNMDKSSNGSAWYAYQYSTPTTIIEATPGQFALQTKPDYALAILRIPGQSANVLVIGSTVCEIWTQIGGIQNYRRANTISVDYGCISVATIATSDSYVCWLAANESNTPVIMVYDISGFKPISTDGIDHQLSHIQYPDQSAGMFFRQDGHLFYQLTFYNEEDNLTFIYDFSTQMFFNLSDWDLNYHPARNYAYFNQHLYFISLNSPAIYLASTDLTTYNENLANIPEDEIDPDIDHEIQRIRICNTIRALDSSQFRANSFVFTIQQGNDRNITGLSLSSAIANSTLPYQPRVDLTVSRDDGFSWGNTVSRGLLPLGNRQNILNWENMGMCNSLVIKLRFWGLSSFICNNGYLEMY